MATPQGSVKPAPIVAELGRAETPLERADRKAESSRLRRENQTPVNLLLALAASLLLVAFLIFVVVRPSPDTPRVVDYSQIAKEAQPTVSEPLAQPTLPRTWSANNARLAAGADGIQTWYVGFITPGQQFIGMTQGIAANSTWVSNQLSDKAPTGSTIVDGVLWTVYNHRSDKDPGNLAYAMVAKFGASDVVLFGTASTTEFHTLAAALAADLTKGG